MKKIYKVTVLVVQRDGIEEDDVKRCIEKAVYPNDVIMPEVMSIETREVEWNEEHPLNITKTMDAEFKRLFSELT